MRPRPTRTLLLLPLLVSFGGCASWYSSRQIHRRSSLLEYLAPHGVISHRGAARLQLPLKIGIAFVPTPGAPLGAESEERLLQIVAKSFTGRDWVGAIRTIPSDYLDPGCGYDDLQQVASPMDVADAASASAAHIP